jgi:hypothetical protein
MKRDFRPRQAFPRSAPYRARRPISAHKALSTAAIALAIAVLVGAVLRGDPGPCLGMCDDHVAAWHDSQSHTTPVPSLVSR